MIIFLTSSPCRRDVPEGSELPCTLNESNGFVDILREVWRPDSRFLIIASDPENFDMNDEMLDTFWKVFPFHGLSVSDMAVCDGRNEEEIGVLLAETDVVLLSGGHVPTENAFFQRLQLRERLQGFEGIVIGVSAGTMNSAEWVYAQPELPGESEDPDYERFLPGLGLTELMILPHYQEVKDQILDGKRLYEDITYSDSEGNSFYVLVDGSFILIEEDGYTAVYGEAYLIRDGEIRQICECGEQRDLPVS